MPECTILKKKIKNFLPRGLVKMFGGPARMFHPLVALPNIVPAARIMYLSVIHASRWGR